MISLNLTTTAGRLDVCSATIWSLIHQSILPDKIFLWVSKDPYMADTGISSDPLWVSEVNNIRDIVRVRYVENTGPYRKIFPALKEASDNDILIYADDDVIYGYNWLELLLSSFYESNSEFAVASRIRIMHKNFLGYYQSYNKYSILTNNKVCTDDFIITGVGGCVLKRKMINCDLINDDSYLKVAPKTDDLWISKILKISGSSVKNCPEALLQIQEIQHSNYSLNHENTIKFSGGIVMRFFHRLRMSIFGYFGKSLSNNDFAQKEIDNYFNKK